MISNILLAVSGIVLIVLCLGVYISNPRKPVNRALAAFLFSGFLWLSANFLTNISTTHSASLFFAKSTLVGAALIPLSFLIFTVIYTRDRNLNKRFFAAIAFLPLSILLFTPTSLNIASVGVGGRDTVAGPVYVLLLSVLIAYFGYGIYILMRFYGKAPPLEKTQLQYIFAGVILTLVPAFITNGLLPILGGAQSYSYGPVSVVAMSVFTTMAIVRHNLLDIRLIVARSLAYVLVLGVLGAIFATILLTLTSVFFEQPISIGLKITYISIALMLALLYPSLKRAFDRVTNKVFFRDYYEPQDVLDKLSDLLVGSVDVQRIERQSAKILSDALKSESFGFLLSSEKDEDKSKQELLKHLLKTKKDFIVTDNLSAPSTGFKELLAAKGVALAIRLKTSHEDLGYMVLGYKQSGGIYSDADIRVLGIAADEVAVGLQNALRFEEIQQFNITLQQKVEEATRELRRVNAKLKELDKTKDEFISMASHQLRTPLTAVKGYLSMVLEGDAGKVSKAEREYTQKAYDSAQKMVYLIADMLNVSRLQTGKFVIENAPTDLAALVEGEVSQLQAGAKVKQIKLVYHKPDNFPKLNLDETKIRQVIMNFLDNALYYTPAGGSVTAELAYTDKEAIFTVTDTGLGVPAAVQHHLFSKFYRAENAKKARPDGTGLGLFMAKKVVVAEGGSVIFKSTEGKGSTFGFSIPLKAAAPEKKPEKEHLPAK